MNNFDYRRKKITPEEQKAILLDLLIELDRFCRQNQIKYYLIAGTLIGAVRHKGFIPWDDDIDVCMLRKDYEHFIKIYKPSSSKYKLMSLERDDSYYYPFAKLVDDETVLIESKKDPGILGVYLDIFALDNCPGDTLNKAAKSIDKLNLLRWLRNFKIIEFSKDRKLIKNIILLLGKIITVPFTRRKIAMMVSKKASKYKNTDCRFIGELMNTAYGHGEVFERSYFAEGTEVVFEGHKFIAPKDYDSVLKSMYGDYMKLPPKEKQISHHDIDCWYK